MTKAQKQKQAKHNAEKDDKRRTYTVAEVEAIRSDMRRQEAEINARIKAAADEVDRDQKTLAAKWRRWTDWFCYYTVPRICVGFYYATLMSAKVYLIKSAREDFMDRISVEMQEVLNYMSEGDEVNLDKFQHYADLLDAEGYAVPEWAQKDDFLNQLDEDDWDELNSDELAVLQEENEELKAENAELKQRIKELEGKLYAKSVCN